MKYLLMISLLILGPALQANASSVELPLDQATSGNYYLHAMLDGTVNSQLLLDTGSGYVSLSQRTFDEMSHDASPMPIRHITGRMADGRSLSVPIYRLGKLQLAENCILTNIEVAVFPHADRDILGLNALRQMQPFTISLSPPQLSATCHS